MQLKKILKEAQNVLIVCHKKPDGDTLGAGFAFWNLCRVYQKNVDIVADSPEPAYYAFMPDFDRLNRQELKTYDLVIAVDCGDIERMGKFQDYAKSIVSINIDHHKTNKGFGKYNHVVPELSSTCEAVYDIFFAEGILDAVPADIRVKIAYCLFIGLSTDTGHFMHSSVTAKTLHTAAALADFGLNVNEIAAYLYQSNTVQKMQLITRALQSIRYFHHGDIGVITVRQRDLIESGCESSETEGLIDYAMKIKSVLVAVCVSEQTEKVFKVSFRSKGLDVSQSAAFFGGGGHVRAAGCTVMGYYEDVIDRIIKAITDGMSD